MNILWKLSVRSRRYKTRHFHVFLHKFDRRNRLRKILISKQHALCYQEEINRRLIAFWVRFLAPASGVFMFRWMFNNLTPCFIYAQRRALGLGHGALEVVVGHRRNHNPHLSTHTGRLLKGNLKYAFGKM